MALTTVKSIGDALNQVEARKQNLKKAFEELQSHSHLLSTFNLTWPELDSYFTSFQLELLDTFSTLQTLELSQNPKPEKQKDSILPVPVPARPELRSLCENMDGLGLRKYVIERPKERIAIRVELADALKHAPDPGSMVLDALDGFWEENLSVGSKIRTACVVLLEELMRAGVEIGDGVRERARAVAVEWKGKVAGVGSRGGDGDVVEKEEEGGLERLGYLLLLAAYKLVDGGGAWDVIELIDHVIVIVRYRQAIELCRILGLEGGISDVVQRLVGKGKRLVALKFILEFGLRDEFPPVPLLKAYFMDSKKNAQKVGKSGKNSRQSLNEAATKEISDLKALIKCIKDHNVESQYPEDELLKRVETLEKEKADRKRPVPASVPKPKRNVNQLKQNGNKRMKTAAGPSTFIRKPGVHSGVLPSHVNGAGLLPGHAAPYLSAPPAGAYGIAGSLAAGAPYLGSSVNAYGLSGGPLGFPGNLNPSASNPYPSETQAQIVYHDNRAKAYGGYDAPSQYHPAYYPQ